MWAEDTERFINWLNALFDDATTYRLPTPEELSDPAVGLVTDLTHHTIWAQSSTGTGPVLYQPDGTSSPCAPAPDRLARYPAQDREALAPYLRLVLAPALGNHRLLAHSHVFVAALHQAPEFGTHPSLRPLQLTLELALARTRDADLARAQALVRVLDSDRALAHALARALDLDLDHALDFLPERPQTVAAALAVHLRLWTSSNARSRPGAAAGFDEFLTGLFRTATQHAPDVPGNPAMALQDARDQLQAAGPITGSVRRGQAGRLADLAHSLITPGLTRTTTYDPSALACARFALLAAAALLRQAEEPGIAALLDNTWCGLAALEERASKHLAPNEVLLLIRN